MMATALDKFLESNPKIEEACISAIGADLGDLDNKMIWGPLRNRWTKPGAWLPNSSNVMTR